LNAHYLEKTNHKYLIEIPNTTNQKPEEILAFFLANRHLVLPTNLMDRRFDYFDGK